MDATLQDRFAMQGYVGPVSVFAPHECRRILRGVRGDTDAVPPDWNKGAAGSSRAVFDVATAPPIVDLVAALIGPDVMLWGASLVARSAGQVHPWHTDIETSEPSSRSVSVWIGLEGTNRRSSLKFISCSHRCGRPVQHVAHLKGRRRSEVRDDDVVDWARAHERASRLVQPMCQNGDALVFDGRLWHASNNTNGFARTALLLQYATPDTCIRTPDLAHLEWPFRFFDTPKPGCIMVNGTDHYGVNRLVKTPSRQVTGNLPLESQVQSLALPLAEDRQTGWKPYHVFRGPTGHLADLSCHVSVLSPGCTPHEPHEHLEEEILLVLDGEADLQIVDDDIEKRHRLQAGSFVYYRAGQRHTLSNRGSKCVTYLMFKWLADVANDGDPLPTNVVPSSDNDIGDPADAGHNGFHPRVVLEGPTRHLNKLQAHVSILEPGAGYPPHADDYDVAIVVHRGTVETLGRTAGPGSVVFYPAGQPHGMRNVGPECALYTVFEFHGLQPAECDGAAEAPRGRNQIVNFLQHTIARTSQRLRASVRPW